jgi:hypothetical protein
MKQDSGVGGRNNGNMLQDFSEGWAFADDIFKAVLSAYLRFEIQLMRIQPTHNRKPPR